MLFKSKLAALLLATGLLASTAVLGNAVLSGQWEDGTTLHWVCPDRKEFNMPIQVTTTDGTVYQGVISCGKVS